MGSLLDRKHWRDWISRAAAAAAAAYAALAPNPGGKKQELKQQSSRPAAAVTFETDLISDHITLHSPKKKSNKPRFLTFSLFVVNFPLREPCKMSDAEWGKSIRGGTF